MQKSELVRRVPAKAAIESVINIISLIVGLIDAIYTLIMKFLTPTTS
jgi:hypothetical protein